MFDFNRIMSGFGKTELESINEQIADLQARMAARDAGMPQRTTPEYRAARFDYIVDGDRSGLDKYDSAVNAAIQNRLNRESTMELAKLNKEQADEEGMDQWQKDYSFAKSAKREIDNDPKSTQKDKDDADATVKYYEAVGRRKGYTNKINSMVAEEEEQNPTPKTPTSNEPVSNWANDSAFAQKVIDTDTSTLEDIDKAEKGLLAYANNSAVAEELGKLTSGLSNKRNKIDTTEKWNKAQEKARAEIARKDVKISDIDAQMKAIEGFKELEGYDKLMTELKNKKTALTPKGPDKDLIAAVKAAWKDEALIVDASKLRRSKDKSDTRSVSVNGKDVPVKRSVVTDKNGNMELRITDKNGNVLRTVKLEN